MKLEPIIQSEVSQKEKHKYYILTCMEFRKMVMTILYTIEYYSAIKRNESESVVVRQMKLEPVTQSEVKSEREKQLLFIKTYILNFEKMVLMNLFAGQEQGCRSKEQTCGHNGEGKGRTN